MSSSPSYKNIVVIGASFAGVQLVQALAAKLPDTYRIVLIESKKYAFYPVGALRAMVEPGFEKEIVHSLSSETIFGTTPASVGRHLVLSGSQVIELKPHSVIYQSKEEEEGSRKEIEFEYCVLATGASYPYPARPTTTTTTTNGEQQEEEEREMNQIVTRFQTLQSDVEKAQKILIVGGGPVGVEMAGEIIDKYPSKSITIVTQTSIIGSPLVHHRLQPQLEQVGIKILYNDTVNLDSIEIANRFSQSISLTTQNQSIPIDYDLVFKAYGSIPNSQLVSKIDSSAVNQRGQIRVTPSLQIQSSSSDGFDWKNYFAIGDCNDFPRAKTAFAVAGQSQTTVENLFTLIGSNASQPSDLKTASSPPNVMVIPIGKRKGASYLYFFSLGAWVTSLVKGKTLFLSKFKAWFKE